MLPDSDAARVSYLYGRNPVMTFPITSPLVFNIHGIGMRSFEKLAATFGTGKRALLALVVAFASPFASASVIQYDNWSGNVTADYHVTINDDTANFFTVRIQVDPGYQADVLAFGFDNGDRYNIVADLGFTPVSPGAGD